MKTYITTVLISLCIAISTNAQDISQMVSSADSLAEKKHFSEAISIYKKIEANIKHDDSLYSHYVYNYATALYFLSYNLLQENKFEKLLDNSFRYLDFTENNLMSTKLHYVKQMALELHYMKYWVYKNIVVASNDLKKLELLKKYRKLLYDGYRASELPPGIDEYYNFQKTIVDNKNVWGYEWFEELPKDRNSKSFSKHVYYVYSRNEDGTDKDQLFAIHTVMFHKLDEGPDYVLTKRTYTEGGIVSETTTEVFNEPVNLDELYEAVEKVIKGDYTPISRSEYKN